MNRKIKICEDADDRNCPNRREFLVKAATGGFVLSLSSASVAEAQSKDGDNKSFKAGVEEMIVKIDEKNPLNEIGGFVTIDTKLGKIIVVRIAVEYFAAVSTVCPHQGGSIRYDDASRELYCPRHDSRFDTRGQILKGPAKTPLKNYATQKALALILSD